MALRVVAASHYNSWIANIRAVTDGHDRMELKATIETCLPRMRCMHTASSLQFVSPEKLRQINHLVETEKVRDGLGRLVTESFDHGLVNEEETVFYPIKNGVIQMLRDELIDLAQLQVEKS